MIVRIAHLSGGPHDGERIELSPPADPVERHFAVTFHDGSRYAWTGKANTRKTDEPVLLLRFDADQSVVRDDLVEHQDVHLLTRSIRSDSDGS